MKGIDVKRIREKLDLTRDDFALIFGLSGPRTVMNIESEFRKPSQLTINILKALDSLPKAKAQSLIDLLRKYADA